MSQWAREHPEEMCEIADLPLSAQGDALRDAQRSHVPPATNAKLQAVAQLDREIQRLQRQDAEDRAR